MLKSIGMTGKSHIVKALQAQHSEWIHLHQSNREYFKLHPEKSPEAVDEIDLYEFFAKNLFDAEIKDGTYITERTPIDYLLYYQYRHFFKKNPEELVFPDGNNYKKRCQEDEFKFLSKFDQVDIYVMFNLDLRWMDKYFHSIPKDDIHKIFYKGRGYFILYQDNWWKAFLQNAFLYNKDEVVFKEFWTFPDDNQKFIEDLLKKYEPNLFQ